MSVLALFFAMRKVDSTKEEVTQLIDNYVEAFRDFYVAEKADLAESIPTIIGGALSSLNFSNMGKKSGVSRQLKGLEKEMISMGVSQATGNEALGPMVAGLVDRYPIIKQLAPMIMGGQKRQGHPQARATINQNNGGYGDM